MVHPILIQNNSTQLRNPGVGLSFGHLFKVICGYFSRSTTITKWVKWWLASLKKPV